MPVAEPEPIPAPMNEPIPAPEWAPIPAPESAPIPAPEVAPPSGEIPFAPWAQVLDRLAQSNPPLRAFLQETTALQNGESLILCIESPLLVEVLKEGGNKQSLVEAIKAVTGRTFAMKLRKAQKVQKTEADPLSQLLTAGRTAGIAVKEN